jgi:hypothetical protein
LTRGASNWRAPPDPSCWQRMQQPLGTWRRRFEMCETKQIPVSYLNLACGHPLVWVRVGRVLQLLPQFDGMHLEVPNFSQSRHEILCGIPDFRFRRCPFRAHSGDVTRDSVPSPCIQSGDVTRDAVPSPCTQW